MLNEGEPDGGQPRRRGWRRVAGPGLLASLAYVLLAMAWFPDIVRDPATVTTCACGDNGIFLFWLGWMPWAIEHVHNPFLTTHIAVPDGVNALWNTSVPLPATLLAPVTLLFGPIASLNVLLLASPALSSITMYAALRRWARPLAAFAGGLVYGFSPFMNGRLIGHLNLSLVMIPPLLLMVADEIVVRQRRSPVRLGVLFGLLLVAQLLTGEEVLATGAVAGFVGLLVLAVRHRAEVRDRWRYAAKAFGVAVAVFAVLAGGPILFQLKGPQHIVGPPQHAAQYGMDPASVVVPTPRVALGNATTDRISQRFAGNSAEKGAYLGVPIVAALAVALVRRRRDPVAGWAAISAIPMAVLSFGPTLVIGGANTGIPLPGRLVEAIPVVESLRFPRFALFTVFFAAVVVARLLDAVPSWRPLLKVPPRLAIVAVAATLLVPIVPAAPFRGRQAGIPEFFTSEAIERIPEASVAVLVPWPSPQESRPMIWQAAAGMRFRMPGGYGIVPGGPDRKARLGPAGTYITAVLHRLRNGTLPIPVDPAIRGEALSDLRRMGVQTVIVGPTYNQQLVISGLADVLGRQPEYHGGVAVWFDVVP